METSLGNRIVLCCSTRVGNLHPGHSVGNGILVCTCTVSGTKVSLLEDKSGCTEPLQLQLVAAIICA